MTFNKPTVSASEIKQFLPEKYKDIYIRAYDILDSTNRLTKEIAANGDKLPLLVVSDSQTAGRGRLGRSFYSPSRTGIYMSVAVGGFASPLDAVFITCAAAVAVSDAIISLTGKKVGIKWVNDIILDGRKICGILAESQKTPDGFSVVLGVGLNMTTEVFPDEILNVAGALNTNVSREEMIAEITKNLLEISESPDNKTFLRKYKERSILLGKEINYFSDGMMKTGVVTDIDQDGGLVILCPDGQKKTLSSGEITIRLK